MILNDYKGDLVEWRCYFYEKEVLWEGGLVFELIFNGREGGCRRKSEEIIISKIKKEIILFVREYYLGWGGFIMY